MEAAAATAWPNLTAPIRSGLTLRDNVLGFRPVSDDLAFDDEPFVGDLRRHHADAAERVVNVVREKRNLPRDRQPRHVDHDGSRPAKKPHLPAGIGKTLDLMPAILRCSNDFKKFSCSHLLSFILCE